MYVTRKCLAHRNAPGLLRSFLQISNGVVWLAEARYSCYCRPPTPVDKEVSLFWGMQTCRCCNAYLCNSFRAFTSESANLSTWK